MSTIDISEQTHRRWALCHQITSGAELPPEVREALAELVAVVGLGVEDWQVYGPSSADTERRYLEAADWRRTARKYGALLAALERS